MGEVVAKRDSPQQSWARLKLDNGDQVLISVAQSGVKIFKMKWAGAIPAATLWESSSIVEVTEKFFDAQNPHQRPLDSIVDKLIDCRSAGEVVTRLLAVGTIPKRSRVDQLGDLDLTAGPLTHALLLRAAHEADESEQWLRDTVGKIKVADEPTDLQEKISSAVAGVTIGIVGNATKNAMGSVAFMPGTPLPAEAPVVVAFAYVIIESMHHLLQKEGSEFELRAAFAKFLNAEFMMHSTEEKMKLHRDASNSFMGIMKSDRKNVLEWRNSLSQLVLLYIRQFTTDDSNLKKQDLRPLFGSMLKSLLSAIE